MANKNLGKKYPHPKCGLGKKCLKLFFIYPWGGSSLPPQHLLELPLPFFSHQVSPQSHSLPLETCQLA